MTRGLALLLLLACGTALMQQESQAARHGSSGRRGRGMGFSVSGTTTATR